MAFDISQLDKFEDDGSEESFQRLEEYQNDILEQFIKSEVGTSLQESVTNIGFWIYQLIHFGYVYNGVSLASMKIGDIEEILQELLPRKVSLESPDDAYEIIPELLAFWKFIQKEYNADPSNQILNYLQDSESGYYHVMNDSSKFGLAKSLMMQGSSSGFDMSNPEDANQFINMYNQNILSSAQTEGPIEITSSLSKKEQLKKKKLRKLKKASRKKNKKRK